MQQTPPTLHPHSDIFAVAHLVEQHISAHWQTVFNECHQEMVDRYQELADGVYGLYATRLFQPILQQLKQAGLKSVPRLPTGNFDISREWGDDETDRQRWFWSKIVRADGTPLGTLAIVYLHDHVQIRVPRPIQVIPLTETSKRDVVAALSRLSPDFAAAQEAREEYAAYTRQESAD